MDNADVPEYFICPISLQMMKDPVTAVSGITYDRESIERWIFNNRGNTICPVTKQPLPRGSDLTPNHTLRRLIQAWCVQNGVVRIPSPKTALTRICVMNLMKGLARPESAMTTINKLDALAVENIRNRVFMVEAGLAKALISFIVSCYRENQRIGLEEVLNLFYIVRTEIRQFRGPLGDDSHEVFDSLMWIFRDFDNVGIKWKAAYALRAVVQKANPSDLERLSLELLKVVLSELCKMSNMSQQGTNSLLHVLLDACPWGRNRIVLVESGAVSDLIEVEHKSTCKKTTELVLAILCHLCSCADGRAQLVDHASGIKTVTRRIRKISATADDRAVFVIWLVSKYSGTNRVLEEMVRVGTVSKLCMVVQSNSDPEVKERAKEILRANSDAWKDLPCLEFE